jgi:hypothetical protein
VFLSPAASFGSSNLVVAFPMVAQKFQFHNLVMKPAGLPCDVAFDDDEEDKKKLGAASNVVFKHCHELLNTAHK